jgi:uncharacterized membrane protein YdjX (TVP38/TMEM64 family)
MSQKELLRKLCAAGIGAFVFWLLYTYSPIKNYFTLNYVQQQNDYYHTFLTDRYYTAVFLYMAVFICTVALSMPSSIILTLLGGSLFGVFAGVFYATLSVVIGVTLACIIYRTFFFKSFAQMYAERIVTFKKALQEYGVSYLLMLHFSAVFPYFVINSIALFAEVPLRTIMWVTVVGFLPQAFVYAFAGKKLSSIRAVGDIFSPAVIIAFMLLILLACVPILIKKYKTNIKL